MPTAHQCVVVRLPEKEMTNFKLRELMPMLKNVINTPLPLIEPPPLERVRETFLFEFPYAAEVIDAVLADLVGRTTVLLRPTVISGEPGGGKSLFVRRLAQVLGVSCARTTPHDPMAPFFRYGSPLEFGRTLPSAARNRARWTRQPNPAN